MTRAPGTGATGTGPPWDRGGRTWVAVPATLLAMLAVLGSAAASRRQPQARPIDPVAAVLLLLAPAALLLVVRRGPSAVLGAVLAVAGPVTYIALGYPPGPAFVPLGVVVVVLGATRQRWLSWTAALAGALGVVAPGSPGVGFTTVTVTGLAVAVLLGEGARERGERMRALRAARTSREESAVAAERLRIARELHDVLAHSLSGITVQAGVGLHLMDREPEAARRALAEIRDASRDALDEVRDVLGILRADGEAPREPAGLGGLVDRARAGGLTVDADGLDADVPQHAASAVHRTLQEALTNVRRHAPGASVQVRLMVGESVVLDVQDDGAPVDAVVEGFGLRGMRERALAAGGALVAESTPSGFHVRLEVPR